MGTRTGTRTYSTVNTITRTFKGTRTNTRIHTIDDTRLD